MTASPVAWQMVEPSAPLELTHPEAVEPGPGEARIAIEGCGVCHTDLGFLHGGVRTRKALPLTLGHEIVGRIEALGPRTAGLETGMPVVVPAVLPCGECDFCRSGRDNICSAQKMPGNDLDGGFASHVTVPAKFLVRVPRIPPGHELRHLAVVADAVTTPYQALIRARVSEGDPVVVVGAGGIGIYGVQIASVLGGRVIAVDVDPDRLEQALGHGAEAVVDVTGLSEQDARKRVQAEAKQAGFPRTGWKVFEMSGTAPGQRLAFSLLTFAGVLGVVGFTMDKIDVRLSNLMAFDADAFGSWGCSPRHYPVVLDLIAEGRIQVKPFVTFEPLDQVNAVLEKAHGGEYKTRPVLVP